MTDSRVFIQLGFVTMEQMNMILAYLKAILRAGSETLGVSDVDRNKSDAIRESKIL